MHLTMLHGIATRGTLPESSAAFIPPAWSISLEWQYYLVAPFLALLARRGWGLLILLAVSAVAIRFQAPWINSLLAFLPPQLPLFLIGIICFQFYRWRRIKDGQGIVRKLVPLFVVMAFAGLVGNHRAALGLWAIAFGCTLPRTRATLALGLPAVRRLLLHPVLQWLGLVSYPLYLVHWPMILAMLWALLHVWPHLSQVQALLILLGAGLPLILLTAQLFHWYVEKPGMDLGRRVIERAKPPALVGVATP